MTTGFHSFVDWGPTRLTEWHMYLTDELHLRSKEARAMRLWSLWQCLVARVDADGDLVGFDRGRPWNISVWLILSKK